MWSSAYSITNEVKWFELKQEYLWPFVNIGILFSLEYQVDSCELDLSTKYP